MASSESIKDKISIDIMDAIYKRHAVRNYLPKKVDSSIIHKLLDAAVHAPTALHEEPRAFAVIQNKDILDRLSASAKALLATEAKNSKSPQTKHILDVATQKEFSIFYNASTLIVIYGTFEGPFIAADCWLAAENLMLSALAFGLASCVIGFAVSALNLPEWKAELGIPEGMTAIAPMIIGWPAENTLPSSHKPTTILTWK
ncbi:TPA: nitroreductase family protein [Legionella feeleii]|uniref:Nitroreductase n=1 Tax=Legionella feeleii TaxID=453 RepID=A0A378IS74_9GAMM|nr:nitroreductase family protein [Legionella feeleii]STX37435.1 nitroreductase [Legionella feeleii]